MKNTITTLSVVCLSITALKAQNLVPNSDFETRDADFCGIAGPTDLANSLANWYSPTGATPDVYFTDVDSDCWNYQTSSTYSGPIGFKGEQLPRSGSSMVGIGTYTIAGMNQREYIQIELASPMVPTGKYVVEYYVSLGDFTQFASDNLGFHLSTSQVQGSGSVNMSAVPQYNLSTVVGETQNWVRVFDTITVSDAYQFLTIGNFMDDAATNVVANATASGEPGTYGAYYYIDDVKVERVFTDVTSVNEQEMINVRIFPNPTTDEITIELSEANDLVEIELIDINGSRLWALKANLHSQTIDLRNYVNGIYFVRVTNHSVSYLKKIVKL